MLKCDGKKPTCGLCAKGQCECDYCVAGGSCETKQHLELDLAQGIENSGEKFILQNDSSIVRKVLANSEISVHVGGNKRFKCAQVQKLKRSNEF